MLCLVLGPDVTTCDSGGKQEQGGAGCQPALDDCSHTRDRDRALLDTVMMGGRSSHTMIFAADNIAAERL